MTNKEQITNLLAKDAEYIMTLGCYDEAIDKLSKKDLKEVMDTIEFYPTSLIKISKSRWVEAERCEREIDLRILSNSEKVKIYGDERE
jgi:hypothetical protein